MQGLRDFEAKARAQGIASERVLAARYILCTALDEVAAGTPWGGGGQWAQHNLLVTFHNETYGGEKVFQLMVKLAEDPATNRDLLELIYAVLNLGFEGRYGVVDGGRAKMEAVREQLAQILRKVRGDYATPLAQHWQGQTQRKRQALTWLPLWISATVAAATGAAMLVPRRLRYGCVAVGTVPHKRASGLAANSVLPGSASDSMPTPGATRSGFCTWSIALGPIELNGATVSSRRSTVPLWLVAPIVSTQGALPGDVMPPSTFWPVGVIP